MTDQAATIEESGSESSRQSAGGSSTRLAIALIALGVASAWLYHWGGDLHRFTQWISAYIGLFIGLFALYLLACYVVLRWSDRVTHRASLLMLSVVVVFGVGFRLQLVDERPFLSTDMNRYIWDGRVQAAGINPYRYVPAAPEVAHLRDQHIYPAINRKDYVFSPYPPVAQAIYLIVYLAQPSSTTAFKVAMSLFDVVTILAIALVLGRLGLEVSRTVVFAWNPLLIFEGAHSGHIESAFIAFLALALLAWTYRRSALVGVALGLATLVKFYPVLLLPAFFSGTRPLLAAAPSELRAGGINARLGRLIVSLRSVLLSKPNLLLIGAFAVTIVVCYMPYIGVGSAVIRPIAGELGEEGFTDEGSRYFLLSLARSILPLPTTVFLGIATLALAVLAIKWLLNEKRDALDVACGSLGLIGLDLLITTPRYPWHYAWMIPFLCFVPRIGWLFMTGATVLLYLLWYTPWEYPELPRWLGAAIFLPTIGLLAWERLRSKRLTQR